MAKKVKTEKKNWTCVNFSYYYKIEYEIPIISIFMRQSEDYYKNF